MAITVQLDKPRAIRWTNRAEARLGSLERPPSFRDIASKNSRRAFYALLSHLWAALEDRDAFAEPEALADHLVTAEAQAEAVSALIRAFVEGGVMAEKKTSAPDATGSSAGPSASSS